MKKCISIFVFSVLVFGCQNVNQQKAKTEDLPVIDLSKDYPKKEILLQDIADIEYIKLETTDDVLVSGISDIANISNDYIVIKDRSQSKIFVFNREGKIISHFNRRGNGPHEHVYGIGRSVVDGKNEEIIILDYNKILVYSFNGDYKRTLPTSEYALKDAYNFDDNNLLICDNNRVIVGSGYSENPYYLMSKKDGSITYVLDIHLPVRYSNNWAEVVELPGGEKSAISNSIDIYNNRYYGQDIVISDISSDTIYLFTRNKVLTPMLVRTPSVHSSDPKVVWTSPMITDRFIILEITTLDIEATEKGKPIPSIYLMYEFETGQIFQISLVNDDNATRQWYPVIDGDLNILKNMTAHLRTAPRLVELYNKKQLKGELGKLVSTLDEEDNPIVEIVKFK